MPASIHCNGCEELALFCRPVAIVVSYVRLWAHRRSYSTWSRVSTEMGDRSRVYRLGI